MERKHEEATLQIPKSLLDLLAIVAETRDMLLIDCLRELVHDASTPIHLIQLKKKAGSDWLMGVMMQNCSGDEIETIMLRSYLEDGGKPMHGGQGHVEVCRLLGIPLDLEENKDDE